MESTPDITVFRSIPEVLNWAKDKTEDLFVIGGGVVYAEMLPHAQELILTEVDAAIDADIFFPKFEKSLYNCTELGHFSTEIGTKYTRKRYFLGCFTPDLCTK
jgi:dihydrofolate reductase